MSTAMIETMPGGRAEPSLETAGWPRQTGTASTDREAERERLEALAGQLSRLCLRASADLRGFQDRHASAIEEECRREAETWPRRAVEAVRRRVEADPRAETIRCDLTPAQQHMIADVMRVRQLWRQRLHDKRRLLAIQLRQVLSEAVPGLDMEIDLSESAAAPPLPSPVLPEMLRVGRSRRWPEHLWRRRWTALEAAGEAAARVRAACLDYARAVVAPAVAELADAVALTDQQIRTTEERARGLLEQRRAELAPTSTSQPRLTA